MRSAASRLHKGFSFAKRFRECSDWICCDGAAWAGRWAQWAPGGAVRDQPFSRVVLDLGCGKGEYTVACAKMRPDVLFVGFDVDAVPRCLAMRSKWRLLLPAPLPTATLAAIPATLRQVRRLSLLIAHAAPQPVLAVICWTLR